MKKLLPILALITGCLWTYSTFASSIGSIDCSGMSCFRAGVEAAGKSLGDTVVTGKGISEAVQDFIIYLLSFLSLVAVIYIMYAGAQLLLKPADEESAAKTKKIIIGVISGILIIWFAWWIVSTIFFVLNNGSKTTFIPKAVAETPIRNVDFTTYGNRIEALAVKINAGYSPELVQELQMLVDGAYDHLPDHSGLYGNKQLYDEVIKALSDYKNSPEGDKILFRGILQSALQKFLAVQRERPDENSNYGIYTIVSHPDANPNRGSAPHSVTFDAKETIDESGTVIPNENYVWWLRIGGDKNKIIGRGKIINYTFDTEGTYSVFLTVNSASKNSKGFTDTISFEDRVTVEVTQPEVNFAIRINDQMADKIVKISTKEALKPIRIDASETRFSSGYTTKSTEWDFGNGNADTNEGDPQFESQMYAPGDHTIRLTLLRNDGEEFSHSIILKIGDPLASIATTKKVFHKGEKAIFQAKKTSNEADVRYVWEVKKQGIEKPLYNFSGTRLEYVFGDIGKYFITLTSIRGDALDKDTIEVDIDSRPPNVQFSSEMVSTEMPNVYIFDGSNSFDPDYPDNQALRFEWLINDVVVQLTETNERNSRGKYTFPEKGTYRVVLRVTDKEGKMKEHKRDIKITSTLSAQLIMRPEVVKRGAKVLLTVTAPRATTYEWTVGSLDPVRTESNRFVTSFPTSGTFPITVTVTDIDKDTNTATGKIYVTEDEQPFSILDIKSDSSLIISQKSVCSGEEAITVDRANSVSFSADRSVNKDGKNNDLTYFWKIGLNKTSTQKNVSYTFDELGCEEISLTVSDKISGAFHTTKTWVKVVNLAPIFSDITVDIENIDMDPMKINLKIVGAKDPDGLIRSYTWYYYTDRDDQAQGFRITRLPEASFVLPKITGRYYFAVLMEDSNGLKVNTKEVSEVLFSTPDLYVNTNLSTPIIDNFRADNAEVKFGDITRLSLDVRTPVASDVSDKAEYRWDIDGDGFYDVKTTTPFYEFKYIYPGEYNPKVKVTHKGISTTKTLTLVVKNNLIPKATIQIMGNKIIAYNTSLGVFQNANWYLDDKKISENKDYLLYEIEGSSARNLRLEISDGKVTESVVYVVQPTLKNKVLLKKITRPLVVLSPLSGGDVIETPDEIIWEDPMVPLFLYLGESRGDIRYYVIDTDIDIDTDLSGGKDDDADNKGTASYRSGRPFQIPKGTKRVTIMKLRIIGNNNQDIDTRQIRVIRKFLTATEADFITDNNEPQVFHLSQEDKDRIEKLRNLITSVPEEEKKEFNKILDQLGDNWYDVAERIQTLNLFSNTVNASTTLSAELKKKILEQISLVYTQGDDEIEEKQLALKMITEYLAKSPKKTQIFGDSETPGLINDIIDNPEYYEANLKVIQKIMDDYVSPDATLSAEVKQDIREKLLILAGSPPAPVDTNIETDATSSTLMLLLWILGGVMCIVFGGVGIIYDRQRLAAQKPVSGENSVPPDVSPSPTTDTTPSDAPPSPEGTSATTPDWLKEESSPFGDEDVFSESVSTGSAEEIHQPDWLQDTSVVPPSATPETTEEPVHTTETQGEVSLAETLPEPTVTASDESLVITEEENIPDWLQGETVEQDNEIEETTSNSKVLEEEITHTPQSTYSHPMTDETNVSPEEAITSVPNVSQDDDIPDWLRGAETVSEDSESIPTEESTPFFSPLDTQGNTGEALSETIPASVKEELPQNDGNKSEIETIQEQQEELLESPTHLLEGAEDSLIASPKAKKPTKKKTPRKQKVIPSDHLLESEHDMLLSPQTPDNTL